MARHARTTITVPPDLKARMEAVEEPVNWSAIACRAFEQRLAEITKRRGARDMQEVINRLRASKQKPEDERYNEGREAGQEWARNQAEAAELIRLEKLREHSGASDWEAFFTTGEREAYGVPQHFVFQVFPEWDGSREASRDFWETQAGDDNGYPDDAFVRGFAEGALEIWDQVKGEL